MRHFFSDVLVSLQLCSLTFSAHLCRTNMDSWDVLGMYCGEEGGLSLVFRLLSDSVAKTLLFARPIPSAAVLIELDDMYSGQPWIVVSTKCEKASYNISKV